MRIDTSCFNNLTFCAKYLSDTISNCRVFLTGGTGFLGKWILASILLANIEYCARIETICLTRDPDKFIKENPYFNAVNLIDFVQGDIRSVKTNLGEFDFLIHSATPSTLQNDAKDLNSIIIEGTKNILSLEANKTLYISSGGVYGNHGKDVCELNEDMTCCPLTPYSKAKVIAENYCKENSSNIVIARPFSFIGPYLPLDAHFAAGNFIAHALYAEDIIIKSDGSALRSYMYPSDFVEWIWKILLEGKSGEVFNVGSDEAISIFELATLIRLERQNSNLAIRILGEPVDPTNISCYIPNITKVKETLNLKIKTSLKDAIHQTFKYIKI